MIDSFNSVPWHVCLADLLFSRFFFQLQRTNRQVPSVGDFSYTLEYYHNLHRWIFRSFCWQKWVCTFVFFHLSMIDSWKMATTSLSQSDLCGGTSSTEVILRINLHKESNSPAMVCPRLLFTRHIEWFSLCLLFMKPQRPTWNVICLQTTLF